MKKRNFQYIIITALTGLLVALAYRFLVLEFITNTTTNRLNAITEAQLSNIKKIEMEKQELESARALQAAQQHAFEKAWNDYYVTPKGCEVFTSDEVMVKCSNHKRRAKEEFRNNYNKSLNSSNINPIHSAH